MQELTPETITEAVLDQMATTPDSRMKQIMASAVKHLHAFARDVNLTPAEWIKGIEFMTAVGKICTPARQEFILLSDTLGLSALVNGLHDETAMEEGTHTSLLGPFYRETTPHLAAGSQIAKHVKPDTEVILYGRVTDVNGKPLADATVSLWQTSANGLYDIQEDPTSVDYRGIFTTDANGSVSGAHGEAARLFDPDGWAGRRNDHGAEASRHAAGAYSFPGRRARLSRTGDGALSARRSASGRRRRVRLFGRSRGRHQSEGSGLPDQGHAEHPLRHAPVARNRGRPGRRTRRRRSGRDPEAAGLTKAAAFNQAALCAGRPGPKASVGHHDVRDSRRRTGADRKV